MLWMWIEALVVNAVLISFAQRTPLLTTQGWIHAGALGTILWGSLGWRGWLAVVVYLVLGSLVTRIGFANKQRRGLAEAREGRRGPENVWGSVTASVVLHDSGGVERGGSATSPEQTFTISIAPVNQAPLFSLNQSMLLGIGLPSIGEPFIFQVSEDADCAPRPGFAAGIVPSPDPNFEAHQSVSFRFEQVDGESDLFTAPVEMTASGTLLLCPAANRNGEAKFALTLLDDGGTQNGGQDVSDAVELTIIVLPVNDLPTFSAPAEVVFLESQHEGPTAVVIEQLTGNHSGGPLDESQNITFVLQPVQSQVPETTQESVPRPITTGAAGQVSCLFAGNSWSNHRSEGQLSGNDAAGLAARYPYSGVLERGTLCGAGAALGMTWEGKVQQTISLMNMRDPAGFMKWD